jgi:vacuolar protein sorting-associated protein 53
MLKAYDTEHAMIFPSHWRVNEMLANSFCEGTREDYKTILQKQKATLDVNLLLSCLQETLDFEQSLEKRFASDVSLPILIPGLRTNQTQRGRTSMDTMASKDDKSPEFSQAISEAFEPYMSLWIESQDKELAKMIPQYKQQPLRNPEEEFNAQLVIHSSTELFHSYRLTLAQCAKLSTGSRLLELSQCFAKYLDQYGQQVLFYFLERQGPQGPSVEDTVLILNTADYCYNTCSQLEERIRNRIDAEFKEKVDLQSQGDAFMGIASAAVRSLVRKVETECEPTWREMRNTPWSKIESVADESTYVAELVRHIRERSEEILKVLHKQQYSRAFCDNVVDSMTNTYIGNIVQCRPVSEAGAEQMLLDSYALKKIFTDLPVLTAEEGTQPSAAYVSPTLPPFPTRSTFSRYYGLLISAIAMSSVSTLPPPKSIRFSRRYKYGHPHQKHSCKLTSSTWAIGPRPTSAKSSISRASAAKLTSTRWSTSSTRIDNRRRMRCYPRTRPGCPRCRSARVPAWALHSPGVPRPQRV